MNDCFYPYRIPGRTVEPIVQRAFVATREKRLLQRRHSRIVTRAMLLISAPGFAPLQHVLTVGTAIDMWALGCRREALATIMTMGAGAITGVGFIGGGVIFMRRDVVRGLTTPLADRAARQD